MINVKFEGTVDNSDEPADRRVNSNVNAAFFARIVHIKKGPVIPPSVPYQPYVAPTVYHKGQTTLKGEIKIDHFPSNLHLARQASGDRGEEAQEVVIDGGAHAVRFGAREHVWRAPRAPMVRAVNARLAGSGRRCRGDTSRRGT